jgi:UDP-N-acetyl-D-glucosamine dehydrogenase
VPEIRLHGRRHRSVKLTPAALKRYDAVVISTHHAAFDYGAIARHARSIVDTRNALRGRKHAKIIRL